MRKARAKNRALRGGLNVGDSHYGNCADVHQTLLSLRRTSWEVNSREKCDNLWTRRLYCRIRERLGVPGRRRRDIPDLLLRDSQPVFWHCEGNIATAEPKTFDFGTGYYRCSQTDLPIGENNSQSSLHNEKIQLMIRPLRSPTVASNREKVVDSRRALKALRANSANQLTH
jgi:hypothetical protein